MNAHLAKLYDLNAHIAAARAVAGEVSERTPGPDRPLLPSQSNHLASLVEAVEFLLDRAAEIAGELEKSMEGGG
jgi:hypothetical protein